LVGVLTLVTLSDRWMSTMEWSLGNEFGQVVHARLSVSPSRRIGSSTLLHVSECELPSG